MQEGTEVEWTVIKDENGVKLQFSEPLEWANFDEKNFSEFAQVIAKVLQSYKEGE